MDRIEAIEVLSGVVRSTGIRETNSSVDEAMRIAHSIVSFPAKEPASLYYLYHTAHHYFVQRQESLSERGREEERGSLEAALELITTWYGERIIPVKEETPMTEYEALDWLVKNSGHAPAGYVDGQRAMKIIKEMRDERRPLQAGDFVQIVSMAGMDIYGTVGKILEGDGYWFTVLIPRAGKFSHHSLHKDFLARYEPSEEFKAIF